MHDFTTLFHKRFYTVFTQAFIQDSMTLLIHLGKNMNIKETKIKRVGFLKFSFSIHERILLA